jgi:hypothetical protein
VTNKYLVVGRNSNSDWRPSTKSWILFQKDIGKKAIGRRRRIERERKKEDKREKKKEEVERLFKRQNTECKAA